MCVRGCDSSKKGERRVKTTRKSLGHPADEPPKEAFAAAMQSWRERCEKCVCLQGDYAEK